MAVATYEKIKKELKKELFQELSGLFMRYSQDPEGEYHKSFVRKVLKLTEQKPRQVYKYSRHDFLSLIS